MGSSGDQDTYHQLNDNHNKAIIQELIETCDDDDVSRIISCYSIGAPDKDIRSKLDKFTKHPHEKAAQFLKIATEGKKKQQLMNEIIITIESLLKELCPKCGEYYNVSLNDDPLFRCIKCHQGCHNQCFEEVHTIMSTLDDRIINSFHFMCASCSEQNKVSKPESEAKKHDSKEVNKNKKQEDLNTSIEDEDYPPSSHPRRPFTVLPSQPISPSHPRSPSHPINPSQPSGPSQPPDPNVPVCPTYKWGRCPNYENCEYRHPPRCWNWLSAGKCRFKKCKYHHPPLCRNSVREHKCLNENCKFFHLTKTLRHNADDEQLKSALHQNNYDMQPQRYEHHSSHDSHVANRAQNHDALIQIANRSQNYDGNDHPPQPRAHVQPNNPNCENRTNNQNEGPLSANNMAFLVKTITDLLREDLKKELSEVKYQVNQLRQMKSQKDQLQFPMLFPVTQNGLPQPHPQNQQFQAISPLVQQAANQTHQHIPTAPHMLNPNPQTAVHNQPQL